MLLLSNSMLQSYFSMCDRVRSGALTAPSSPPAGFCSDTKLDAKRYKTKTGSNLCLDQAVGCNELLGALRQANLASNPCAGLLFRKHFVMCHSFFKL